MGKTKRFDIHENAPEGDITFCAKPAKFAGATNTKRKANFGVETREPQGTTFMGNKSHLNFPKADVGVKDVKVESAKSGHYSPAKSGPQNFGGSVGVKGPGRK